MTWSRGQCAPRRDAAMNRGAVLLEVVVAVAILLMAAITITGAVNQGVRVMERSRLELHAADLARSAIAEIEAGIATPETLNGPVREEAPPAPNAGEEDGGKGVNAPGGDAPPRPTGWDLEVGVTPSPFAGLSKVSVRAVKRRIGGGDEVEASYALTQLVRLSARTEDRAGQAGDLTTESDRGAKTRDRTRPIGGQDGQGGAP